MCYNHNFWHKCAFASSQLLWCYLKATYISLRQSFSALIRCTFWAGLFFAVETVLCTVGFLSTSLVYLLDATCILPVITTQSTSRHGQSSLCVVCVCVELFGNHHPLKNRCLNILSLYLPLTGEMSLCLGYETKMCDHGYYNRICLFNSNDNISNIYAFIVPTMLSTLPIFCPQTQRRKVLLISLLFKLKHNRLNDLPKIKHFLLLF